jgi:opacity protein-like surface antigen
MKKFAIALLLFATAAFCFGQAPGPALSTLGARNEVYAGFLATSADYGVDIFDLSLYGGEIAYTRNFNPRWGVTAAAAVSGESRSNVKEFSGTVGPRCNLLTGRIRPYITAQIGLAYQSSNGLYAAVHHPPLRPGSSDTESGFTYRVGGGADFQVTHSFYWRMFSWDIQPQPWGQHTPWYQNVGGGIGYRF